MDTLGAIRVSLMERRSRREVSVVTMMVPALHSFHYTIYFTIKGKGKGL